MTEHQDRVDRLGEILTEVANLAKAGAYDQYTEVEMRQLAIVYLIQFPGVPSLEVIQWATDSLAMVFAVGFFYGEQAGQLRPFETLLTEEES